MELFSTENVKLSNNCLQGNIYFIFYDIYLLINKIVLINKYITTFRTPCIYIRAKTVQV